ncbi:ABC transporter permease [Streptomyces litchfieldiae]|uniref:ABC transporter permease n=1 Tax=Streptomyces litchfieldiae TaxID=3075543 RepID=A0ABU2MTR8_9ACTN|nr:ABC transporter permease [Streptomyces sp. DSM 44938]MDT0345036.1 ABC transporter permease [Streptomyces sp. DSM 44938]
MSGTWSPARIPDAGARRRMRALGRAEMTLLLRNRTALFVALLMPVGMVGMSWSSSRELDLAGTGLSRGEAVLTGGVGLVLVMVVYLGLVPTYVARREERVLKRLRTGELTDAEIMAGTALPAAALAVAQCVVLVASGSVVLDVAAPRQVPLLIVGLVMGVVLLTACAAATASFTRTVESAQITGLPLLMVSVVGSGLYVPLEVLPDRVADVCRLLPLTAVVELIKGGWLGGLDGTGLLRALGLAVAWTALAVFAVRRWFRWEPRH